MDERIFRLRKQILKNLQHNWKIEKSAELVDLSVPHLQRLSKAEVEKACRLVGTDKPDAKMIGGF